jgi:diguanylate cyclase (GGDEF)-like protein
MASIGLIACSAIAILVVLFLVGQELRLIFLRRKLGEAIVRTEKRNIQLSYLIKTTQTLSSALNKNKLLRLIIETFGEITKSERAPSLCALYLMDYNINRYIYETGFNMDVTMLNRSSYSIDDQPFKLAKKSKGITYLDEKDDVKRLFFKESKLHRLQDIEFGLLIPMVVENEIMGVVVAFLPKSSLEFLRKEHALLQVIAGQASIALGSAVQSELAVLDRLTKTYNHAYFEGRLAQEVARSDRYKFPVSVLMIDIDHFKLINDTYGHQHGDIILKEVARVIKSNVRVIDLCARYGGEEFAVILPETDLSAFSKRKDGKILDETGGAIEKAKNLRRFIEDMEITTVEGLRTKLTVSIGVGVKRFPEGAGMGKDQLIKEADKQLYRAKQEGRNCVCHS